MGCAPASERSTMESLRCPKAMPVRASTQIPDASGPRWRRLSLMARAIAPSRSSARFERRAKSPAMPHMLRNHVWSSFEALPGFQPQTPVQPVVARHAIGNRESILGESSGSLAHPLTQSLIACQLHDCAG